MKRIVLAAALAAALPAAASATCTDAPREKWLKREQVQEKLQAQGYDVRRVKVDGSCYEVKALRAGKRIEAHVNPVDARVVREKQKDAS